MEIENLISWAFQVLMIGGAGMIWSELKKLRDRDIQIERRLSDLERRLAERYVTRSELEDRISSMVSRIETSIQSLERHMNEKFGLLRDLIDKDSKTKS